jgi:ferredoxin
MRVVVDMELCESNAICTGLVPSVFELDDDDVLHVLVDEPDTDLREDLEAAARGCPKQAISLIG